MGAQDQTHIDGPAVRNIGTAIGNLAEDVNSFPELNDMAPKSGDFAVGHWLDDLVNQRRDTLQKHCTELGGTLREISSKLKTLAADIERVDQNNGDQLKKLNDEVESTMGQMRDRIGAIAPELSGGQQTQQTPQTQQT